MVEYPVIKQLGLEGYLQVYEKTELPPIKIITSGNSYSVTVPFGSFAAWIRENKDLAYRRFGFTSVAEEVRVLEKYAALAQKTHGCLKRGVYVLENRLNQESGEGYVNAPSELTTWYTRWNREVTIEDQKVHFLLSGLLKRPEDQFLETVAALDRTTLMAVIRNHKPSSSPIFVYAKVEPKTVQAGLLVANPDGLSAWLEEQGLKEGRYTIQ